MTTRFGFGFERRSPNSPSTQFAQSLFLEFLPRLREDVVISLFEIAFKPFSQFLRQHEEEILSIERRIEPIPFPRDTAIKIFIHHRSVLGYEKGGEPVVDGLNKWSTKWNLIDEWCLNHAVLTLRERHLASVSGTAPDPLGAWQDAIFAGLKCDSIFTQAEFHQEFRQQGLFEFVYVFEDLKLAIDGPFWRPIRDFKKDVDEKFKAIGGSTIRGARKALAYQLGRYLADVDAITTRLNLEEPPVRWADDHFNWLINYQLPPYQKYREIGREFNRDEATIREGVQDVATLIGLTLRPSERGRPKGTQDSKPRHRATTN